MEKSNKMNMSVAAVIVLVVVAVLVYITINKRSETNTMEENTQTNQMNDSEKVAKAGDTVAMNYTGTLQDGTVFDSNIDPKFNHVTPFIFTLGVGQVIPGWDKGIAGMKVGEKKHLVIAPEDAYGASGAGSAIPPNATLIFDVELLAIK
ncbi:MAG: FKBP-type peptidyl-prolyl cis-trans isomerase [Patescibacteria group bacterium]